MNIKTFIATTAVAIALPLSAIAGDKDPEKKAEWIAEKLELDDARAEQVETILTDYHEGKKELKKQKKERLESTLSEEERDKLKEMWKEEKRKHSKEHDDRHKRMDQKHHMDKKEHYKERMEKKDAMGSDDPS